jgi:type VI secretion system protein ImpJ
VYLAISQQPSVTLEASEVPGEQSHGRYRVEVQSLHDMAEQTAPVDVALLKLRAFWTTDVNASAHQHLIACARFKSDGFRWFFDDDFIAPILCINASASLMSGLRALHQALNNKCRLLRERLSLNQKNMAGNDPWGQQSRAMLQHMTSALHPLAHVLVQGLATPESVYLDLLRLWGALSCFAETCLTETPPAFNASQPGTCFYPLLASLQAALVQAEDQRIHVPPLSVVKPGLWMAELSDDLDETLFDFYLSLQSAHPQTDWVVSVPVRVKMGSIDDVNRLLHSALPGVPLSHSAAAPGSLPVLVGRHYFSLEKGNELFRRMMAHRRLFIYCPPSFEDLQLEVILVKRGLA